MSVPLALLRSAVLVPIAAISLNADARSCGFQRLFQQGDERGTQTVQVYQGDPVPAIGNARPLLFITSLKVNTDGTKISYHEMDVTGRRCASDPTATPCAINNIRHAFRNSQRPASDFEAIRDAGYPNPQTWQILSPQIIERNSKTGKPCVTPDGYLVSMTADVAVSGGFNSQGNCDQAKWIDALVVPTFVIPRDSRFFSLGVATRSAVIAFSRSETKRVVPAVVGDIGPPAELGEASVAMNRMLNGLPDTEVPRHYGDAIERFQAGPTAVLIFPGRAAVLARPITAQRVAEGGRETLAKFGGSDKVYDCIKNEIDASF